MNKLIFNFKSVKLREKDKPKNILGGKGANLAEMGRMGLPVPPGFIISTNVCDLFYKNKKNLPKKIITQINREINLIENFDPFNNSEHPHNHYIQAFAETGVFGGTFYCLMAISIILNFYKTTKLQLNYINRYFKFSIFITSVCLFWPFSNGHDLFGQQQNSYLWYALSLIMALGCIIKNTNRASNT